MHRSILAAILSVSFTRARCAGAWQLMSQDGNIAELGVRGRGSGNDSLCLTSPLGSTFSKRAHEETVATSLCYTYHPPLYFLHTHWAQLACCQWLTQAWGPCQLCHMTGNYSVSESVGIGARRLGALALPSTCWMTSGKPLHLPSPQFPGL
jgi:hypothetical protein